MELPVFLGKKDQTARWEGSPLRRLPSRARARERGFAIAPILYLLTLAGVAASVLYGGYSQLLRSQAQATNALAAKNELAAAFATLSATSEFSADELLLCPPGSSADTVGQCAASATATKIKMMLFSEVAASDTARLPTNYGNANASASAQEVGVFSAGAGIKQLDPWGHFYVYCRWENARSSPALPAVQIISAGANGKIETVCGAATPSGDDQMVLSSVGNSINRSALWQATGTSSVSYGSTGSQVHINADGTIEAKNLVLSDSATFAGGLNLSTPLPVTSGGTGASTIGVARANLGSGAVGDALFTATTSPGARAILGSGTIGDALFISNTATDARNTLGATSMGHYLFSSATGDASEAYNVRRLLLASSTVGDAVFTSDAHGGRTALGATATGEYLFSSQVFDSSLAASARTNLLGSGSMGDTLFLSNTATAARGALGAGAIGGPLFLSTSQAMAWSILGLTGTTGTTLDVSISGGAQTVPASGITGIVSITQGGTGASNVSDARSNLGTNNAANITTGTLDYERLADFSIPSVKMTLTGVAAGTYNWGIVDSAGRVVQAYNVTQAEIVDGYGQAITTTGTGDSIVFQTASQNQMILTATGSLGLGTMQPSTKLHVNNGNIRISGAAGTMRELQFATGTGGSAERWVVGANGTAESSNSGSDFVIQNYNDAGSQISTPMTISRATGNVNFAGNVTANNFIGNLTGNVTGSVSGGVTGTMGLDDGAIGTPSLYFKNDTSMGLYRPGSLTMAFVSGGAETLRMTATHSVGIGTTAPAYTLDVAGGAGAQMIHITGTTTGAGIGGATGTGNMGALLYSNGAGGTASDASNLIWDATNKYLGIGTTVPRATIDAGGSTGAIIVPSGITSARPTAVAGMIRFNTSNTMFEGYNGTAWSSLAGGTATGSSGYLGSSATLTAPSRSDDITTGLFSTATATLSAAISGTEKMRVTATSIALGTGTARSDIDAGYAVGSLIVPTGTTGQRPTSGVSGMIRYNTTLGSFEGYTASAWGGLGGAGSGSGSATKISMIVSTGTSCTATCAASGMSCATSIYEDQSFASTGARVLRYPQSCSVAGDCLCYSGGGTTYLGSSATLTSPSRSDDVTTGLFSTATATVSTSISGTEKLRVTATSIALGTGTARAGVDAGYYTDSLLVPTGTTGQRPASGVSGMIRYNTTLGAFEGYTASAWGSLGAGATSTGVAGQSMVKGWPDAIICTMTGQVNTLIMYLNYAPYSGGLYYYRNNEDLGSPSYTQIGYNSDGSFSTFGSTRGTYTSAGTCANKSISQLSANGQAFNFVNSGGSLGAIADGTSAAPGLYFTAETNTGIYRPTSSAIAFATNSTEKLRITGTGSFGFNTITPRDAVDMGANTTSLIVPTGTTGQRPTTGVSGMIRYNTTLGAFEGYTASAWGSLGAGATSTGVAGQSVIPGWPDAIVCNDLSTTPHLQRIWLAGDMPYASGYNNYYSVGGDSAYYITFNSDGSFRSMTHPDTWDCASNAWSISALKSNGRAFNYVNSGGSSGSMSDGTSGAPGLYFTAETNTGIYRPTSSAIAFATNSTEKLRITGTGSFGFNTITPRDAVDMGANTTSLIVPTGTTGQRPTTGVSGMIRYNSTLGAFEGYTASTWGSLGSGGSSTLGASSTQTSPSRSGDVTTGLYSNTATSVSVAIGGVQVLSVVATGLISNGQILVQTSSTSGVYANTVSGGTVYGLYANTVTGTAAATGVMANSVNGPTAYGFRNGTVTGGGTAYGIYSATVTAATSYGIYTNSVYGTTSYGLFNNTITGSTAVGVSNVSVSGNNGYGVQNTAVSGSTNAYGVYNGTVSGTNIYGLYNNNMTGTNVYGFYNANLVGGNSAYGLYIGTISAAKAYSIYSTATANSYLAGSLGIGTSTPRAPLDAGYFTTSLIVPTGTTGQRPATGVSGMIRYNTTSGAFEGYTASAWGGLGGSSSLGASATAAAPARADDATTGLFSTATGTVSTAIAGAEAMRVSASGVTLATETQSFSIASTRMLFMPGGDYQSIAVGAAALASQTASYLKNTAVGNGALYATTNGEKNTGVGYNALNGNITGIENTAVGSMALGVNTTGHDNAAVGVYALTKNTTGYGNSAFGVGALYNNLTGGNNTAIGSGALQYDLDGNNNVAVGYDAMMYVSAGDNNTVLGSFAYGHSATITGSRNTIIGNAVASTTLTSGSNNILIGTSNAVDTPLAGTSNWLNIGNTIYGDLSAGNIAIGTATIRSGATLDLGGRSDSLIVPTGTTGQRPSTGVVGMMRYNTTSGLFEGYTASGWGGLGSPTTSTGVNGQSMFAGWPDAIVCKFTTPAWGTHVLYATYMPYSANGKYYYVSSDAAGARLAVGFNADGSYFANDYYNTSTWGSASADCITGAWSISQYVSMGKAFNFANGGGTATGAISDGTSGAPGLYFTAETNTGLYRPTASAIGFATSGVEKLRITGTGSVGIGTTAPRAFVDMGASTDSLIVPTGTTGQRPSTGVVGMLRYNTTSGLFEGYTASGWGGLGSPTTSTGVNGQSMFAGWPDVIVCPDSAGNKLYNLISRDSSGNGYYRSTENMYGDLYFKYASTGAYISFTHVNGTSDYSTVTNDCATNAWPISYLVANGKAFNIVNGGGSSTGAISDGTSGAPGLSFSAETNTGLYRPTASTIGFATSSVERMRITGTGSVGIGTTTPAYPLQVTATSGTAVYGSSASSGCYGYLGGDSYSAGGNCGTSYSSDERLKTQIVEVQSGLDTVMKLRPVSYMWAQEGKNHALVTDADHKAQSYGFIAQDVMKVLPDLVTKTPEKNPKDGSTYFGLDYNGFIAPLVKAVQELYVKVQALISDNAKLWAEIKSLRSENEELKKRLDRLEKSVNEMKDKGK